MFQESLRQFIEVTRQYFKESASLDSHFMTMAGNLV